MTGFLLRVSQDNFQVSVGAVFLSGGPGEESTPKLVLVVGRTQLLAAFKMGPSVDVLSVTCWSLPAPRGHTHSLPCSPLLPQGHQQKLSCALNLLHPWYFSFSEYDL